MGYANTLIAVADDCPVSVSEIPAARGAKKTIAMLHYELLANRPYQFTQEDILFTTWLKQRELAGDDVNGDTAASREQFFSTPKACLRASPLPKKHGWGLWFDDQGRIALCAMESSAYQEAVAGQTGGVTVLNALRARRA